MKHKDGNLWIITLENAEALEQKIPRKVFAAFLKCFKGADQLLALEDLVVSLGDDDSVAGRRKRSTLIFLLTATMREVGIALQELCNSPILPHVSDPALWAPLNALRAKWHNDKTFNHYRNNVGFHLGKPEFYNQGIESKIRDKGPDLKFAEIDGESRYSIWVTLASDVLFSGMGMEDDEAEHVIRETQKGHLTLPNDLGRLWFDVLRKAGVEIDAS